MLKKKISKVITNTKIDYIYDKGINSGAIGGKLLGAGAGGFFLFYVPKSNHTKFKKGMRQFVNVPFKFEEKGSTIIKIK